MNDGIRVLLPDLVENLAKQFHVHDSLVNMIIPFAVTTNAHRAMEIAGSVDLNEVSPASKLKHSGRHRSASFCEWPGSLFVFSYKFWCHLLQDTLNYRRCMMAFVSEKPVLSKVEFYHVYLNP